MELRANGFLVTGGSKTDARLIFKCVQCRKQRRPAEEQEMSDLPEERCEISAPFAFCGTDCFGPFAVQKGRKEIKRYGLIGGETTYFLRGMQTHDRRAPY